jgi:hypothetical protein
MQKKIKKTKRLRKKSNNPRKKLLEIADAALQDFYRKNYSEMRCEGCGMPMQLMHHFILKSQSNFLRYNIINLIFICKSCHSMVHGFRGGPIIGRIVLHRGEKWLDLIRTSEKIRIDLGIKKLREIIEKYNG